MSKIFILGASDIEMNTIEELLTLHKVKWYAAQYNNRRVRPANAYQANGLRGFPLRRKLKPESVITVECHLQGLEPGKVIDHHNEGDPGYHIPPERYLEGSSLGQVASYLGIELNSMQKCIAAGDHCLNYAYQGLCPGVDVEELRYVRALNLAKHNKITVDEMEKRLTTGYEEMMNSSERIQVGDEEIMLVTKDILHLQEISARAAVPLIYRMDCPEGTKVGILNAKPETVALWMRDCELHNVYGNPHRGYAGGYL